MRRVVGGVRPWRKALWYLAVSLVVVHAVICLVESAAIVRARIRFVAWWRQASVEQREDYLYGPLNADLTRLCLRVIPPGDRLLLRTDSDPWLLNYYLYPRQLFQETAVPDASSRVVRPSPRQLSYPVRSDIEGGWVVQDFAAGEGRRQSVERVPGRVR